MPRTPDLSLANTRTLLWLTIFIYEVKGFVPIGIIVTGILLMGSLSQLARGRRVMHENIAGCCR
ncbi:hypothetical protein GGS21DRAFT_503232 [Xylaria nigripes]|nr:hypothetical protein GGS21DRAFT_503232 [Xylaria nigripes]